MSEELIRVAVGNIMDAVSDIIEQRDRLIRERDEAWAERSDAMCEIGHLQVRLFNANRERDEAEARGYRRGVEDAADKVQSMRTSTTAGAAHAILALLEQTGEKK